MMAATQARPAGWEGRLAAFLDARRRTPFAWGHNDCGLFACDARERITGHDAGAFFRGRYRTAGGAERRLRAFLKDQGRALQDRPTIEQVVEAVADAHGLAEIPPLRAQRGDWVLVAMETTEGLRDVVLMVVDDTGMQAMAPAPEGLATAPMGAWRRAWRV